jgi:hypothetical protein
MVRIKPKQLEIHVNKEVERLGVGCVYINDVENVLEELIGTCGPRFDIEKKCVYIHKIRSVPLYAVALHELGHAALGHQAVMLRGAFDSVDRAQLAYEVVIDQEMEAWDWAKERSKVEITPDILRATLGTYVYSVGVYGSKTNIPTDIKVHFLPQENHPVWELLSWKRAKIAEEVAEGIVARAQSGVTLSKKYRTLERYREQRQIWGTSPAMTLKTKAWEKVVWLTRV